ncbi:hypothetical protein I0Q12_13070, partial [Rhodococcus sp. CX]|uniref:hypothetical protein n=1 Tax=Rhodococcus sp. CX TaxID=2789880 RepID=UPI001A3404A5
MDRSKSAPARRGRSLRRMTGCATLAVGASLMGVSCSGGEPGDAAPAEAAEQYRPPEQIQGATVVWSAEPGVYLQDEYGKLVRAAEEARFVARYVGIENSYPGFAAALDPASAGMITPLPDRQPVGTLRAHVLSITPTGTGFEAAVCTERSELAEKWPDGRYHFTKTPEIEAVVRFARTASPAEAIEPAADAAADSKQTSSQRQWRSPATDLFTGSGWTVDFAADPAGTRERCQAWGRSIQTERTDTDTSATPPRVLPA